VGGEQAGLGAGGGRGRFEKTSVHVLLVYRGGVLAACGLWQDDFVVIKGVVRDIAGKTLGLMQYGAIFGAGREHASNGIA
jgi:hypothetical protein